MKAQAKYIILPLSKSKYPLCIVLMPISIRIESFYYIWYSPVICVDVNTSLLQWLDLRDSDVGAFAALPFEFFFIFRTAYMYICIPSEQSWCECKSLDQWKQCWDKHQWAGLPGYMNCAWMALRKDFSCWLSGFQRKHWNEATWLQEQVKTWYKTDVLCTETAAEVNRSSLSGVRMLIWEVCWQMVFKPSLNSDGFSWRQGDLKEKKNHKRNLKWFTQA